MAIDNQKKFTLDLQHTLKRWVFDDERTIQINGTYLNATRLPKMVVDGSDGELMYNPYVFGDEEDAEEQE